MVIYRVKLANFELHWGRKIVITFLIISIQVNKKKFKKITGNKTSEVCKPKNKRIRFYEVIHQMKLSFQKIFGAVWQFFVPDLAIEILKNTGTFGTNNFCNTK